MTKECKESDHGMCDGIVENQQACSCPCHEEDEEDEEDE